MEENNKILLLEQEFKNFKHQIEKLLSDIILTSKEQDKRLLELEKSQEKTDFQYEQILKTLDTLNNTTIPNLTKEVSELKNKPVKKMDQITTGLIGTILGAIAGAIIGAFTKLIIK